MVVKSNSNMKFCQLIIFSKNKQSIFKFLNACVKNKTLMTILKFSRKKNKKKIITILKSPHINKTAQEQFEEKLMLYKTNVKSRNLAKFLVMLKKIFTTYSLEIKILIHFKVSKIKPEKSLQFYIKNNKLVLPKTNKLKIFSCSDKLKLLQNAKNNLKQFENSGLYN